MTESGPHLLTAREREGLLEEALESVLTGEGRLIVGGDEGRLLWEATVDCFISGIWVGSILSAQATCERFLAGLVSWHELPGYGQPGPTGWEKWGLGKLISHVREQGWVDTELLGEVEILCETRKPYGHWRRPFDPGTLGDKVATQLRRGRGRDDVVGLREEVLSSDAFHAAVTAGTLYLGGITP